MGTRPTPAEPEVLPLEPGDRLSRAEFEKRYEAMPHLRKAELIEGVVYTPSPVRHRRHGLPHFHFIAWLGAYEAATPGTEGGDNSTSRLETKNEPQPDALLLISPECGGQARISADDYIEGAAELLAEISSSSASYDLHSKLEVYRRCGALEYIVWRVLDRKIDWFVLRGEQYEVLAPDIDGILKSKTFPGLWLDAAALVDGNLQRVHEVLRRGLGSTEHRVFVQQLQAKRES